MAFKFPGTQIGLGTVGDIIQGKSVGSAANAAVTKGADLIMSASSTATNQAISKGITKLEGKLGVGLGRPSIEKILEDPLGALSSILGSNGGSTVKGGWYPLLANRPDPLMEIDWAPSFPLGLPPEYVEEIQWSHSRFTASSGIFYQGARIFLIEGMENAPITVTFYEDRMLTVQSWLYKWRSLQFDEYNRVFGWKADYSLDIGAIVKDVAGVAVGQVLFAGAFPTGYPQVNMAAEGSQRVRLQVEFSVDRVLFETYSGAGGGGSGTSSWMNIIKDGVGELKDAAFGDLKASAQPYLDTANAYIGQAKAGVQDLFKSAAGSIKF